MSPLTIAIILGASALTGCQTYEARPLEPELHRAAWHGRTLQGESLTEFLERLDHELGEFGADFDPSDGLSLREGQLVALVYNPGLRLARLELERAAASAEFAGLWADPQLSVNALKVTSSVPDPWILNPALTVSIPISGRLGVERDLANARQRAATRGVLEAEWEVWNGVRQAWYGWTAASLRVEETSRYVEGMQSLVDMAEILAVSGEMPRAEAALFVVEQSKRRNDLRRLRGEVQAAEQRLRARLGLAPDAPVDLQPSLELGATDLGETAAVDVTHNPGLGRLRQSYLAAEEALRLEIRRQVPDLTLGPQLEDEQGRLSVGILGSIPIPLWNRNRRAIAEARVRRELARASFETEYELLVGRWAVAHARLTALGEQRDDMEQVLVPLVDRQLTDALALLELGEGSSLVLLASLTRTLETKLGLIAVREAEARAHVELETLTGPPQADARTEIHGASK